MLILIKLKKAFSCKIKSPYDETNKYFRTPVALLLQFLQNTAMVWAHFACGYVAYYRLLCTETETETEKEPATLTIFFPSENLQKSRRKRLFFVSYNIFTPKSPKGDFWLLKKPN